MVVQYRLLSLRFSIMLVVTLISYAGALFNCNFDIAEEESTIYIFVVPCTYIYTVPIVVVHRIHSKE